LRGGSGPEVWRTTFEHSADGIWTNLGAGSRIMGGWQLTGLAVPPGGTIRARGHATGGLGNASSWFAESLFGVPVVLRQPSSLTNEAGATAIFNVLARGTEPLHLQWRKDGVPLQDGGNIVGALTSTLSVSNVFAADAGAYSLVASNGEGSVTSLVATLTVIDPIITSQPISQSQETGETVVFSVTAIGTAPLNYQWWKDGSPFFTGAVLALTSLQQSDAGLYFAVVSNTSGSVTSAVAQRPTRFVALALLTGRESARHHLRRRSLCGRGKRRHASYLARRSGLG
jgi:hypothetical protein